MQRTSSSVWLGVSCFDRDPFAKNRVFPCPGSCHGNGEGRDASCGHRLCCQAEMRDERQREGMRACVCPCVSEREYPVQTTLNHNSPFWDKKMHRCNRGETEELCTNDSQMSKCV